MSALQSNANSKEDEDASDLQRPLSPPYHLTFEARGVHPPTFSALKPRDTRFPGSQPFSHIAWNCDGKKLAAVGVDKTVRVWTPDKSNLEPRSAAFFSNGHSEDVDYVSWNPTHPDLFCSSSQRDRRIVFWDARQSRYIQSCSVHHPPVQTGYSPNGRELFWLSAPTFQYLNFMKLGREKEDSPKETWLPNPVHDPTSLKKDAEGSVIPLSGRPLQASLACWDNSGSHILITLNHNASVKALRYPMLKEFKSCPAHVGGVTAMAFDPRGRYHATGGADSIVNLFDPEDWICVRTITSCEYSITGLSFSHDGEYLAISSAGPYIDICAVETGLLLHRVPTPAPAPVVTWHPSKYVIAYCGQTQVRPEGGPPPTTTISLFGLLE